MSDNAWKEVSNSAPAWDPESQPEISGILKDVKEDVGKFHSTLCTLTLADGSDVAVWCNKVLAEKMLQVSVGHEVKVTFTGMVAAKSGTGEYKNYSVASRPAAMKPVGEKEEPGF